MPVIAKLNPMEAKFLELIDKFDANSQEAQVLDLRAASLMTANEHINSSIVLLCELMGLPPEASEMADKIANDLRKKRDAK